MSEYGELKWTDVSEDYVRAYSTYHSEEMFDETAVFGRPKNIEHYRLTNMLIQGRLWLYTLTQERSLRSLKKQFSAGQRSDRRSYRKKLSSKVRDPYGHLRKGAK
ncbi:hypothetical protein NVP2275O_157 [Vibrio phage 2.275.O._10N.286.54.E11]|nr:hypothetical protein NVP2275O_157 [Vibrio phage 2.275.O._10N.286.54.E11]